MGANGLLKHVQQCRAWRYERAFFLEYSAAQYYMPLMISAFPLFPWWLEPGFSSIL